MPATHNPLPTKHFSGVNVNTIIRLTDVTAGYDNIPILENISLEVHAGDFLGVIGPNGGGKTTLVKIITGLLKPISGEITVFSKSPQAFSTADRKRLGYVKQETNLDTSFPVNVLDTVLMGLYTGMPPGARPGKKEKDAAMEALKKVSLQDYAKNHIGALSGGQRQRVLIARAIVHSPELLILDEPTTGIDMKHQAEFYDLLYDLKQSMNLTVIMVSHDINDLAQRVSKVSCVNKSLHIHGKIEGILEDEQVCNVCGIDTAKIARLSGKKLEDHHHD